MSVANLAEETRRRRRPPPSDGDDSRPTIRLQPGRETAAIDAAEEAMITAGPGPLFQRGGEIVQVADRAIRLLDGAEGRHLVIVPVSAAAVRELFSQVARFERFDKRTKEWCVVDPPRALAEAYLARGRWRLPALRHLVSSPTLRGDGSLLNAAGYDERTGLYLTEPLSGLALPERPTRAEAEDANDLLTELLRSFPFVREPAGEALAIAMAGLLGAILRPTLDAAPLIGVSAPAAGSGKSYLVDLLVSIATGRRAAGIATGSDPAEMEKALGAAALEGRSTIVLDNLEQALGGQLICMFLSGQERVAVRVLGASKSVEVPAAASWFATGNSLRVAGDMSRRALVCRLDAGVEHPEEREFEHDLLSEVRRRRATLVSAALTIARWGHIDPQPPGKPFAGFSAWCRRVRDPLLALGHTDPVGALAAVRATDLEAARLAELLGAWSATFGEVPQTSAAVIEAAEANPSLRDALQGITARGAITNRWLGNYLARHDGRIAGGLRVERVGSHARAIRWAVASGQERVSW